jgi:cytochrome c
MRIGIVIYATALTVTVAAAGQAASKTILEGVYDEAQAKRGEAAFMKTCAACHKADLTGDESKESPALVGEEFVSSWEGSTLEELFRVIKTTMPQSQPGGPRPGSLPDQEYIDIVAFLLHSNKFPAGKAALGTDLEALKTVKIVPHKS